MKSTIRRGILGAICGILTLGAMFAASAQSLTDQQLITLRTAINAETNPEFVDYRQQGAVGAMADWFNVAATPTYYVKRTALSRHEILTGTSDQGTTFAWAGAGYITRAQGERDAFLQMFNSTGTVNPSLPSIVAAFADIFSGAGGAPNRTHITNMSRRPATRVEKLFATGAGTQIGPSTMAFEGALNPSDVIKAINLP